MATVSKTFNGGNEAPTLKLTVTPKAYNVETNTTPVDYSFVIERPSAIESSAVKSFTVTIGGQTITGRTSIGGEGDKTLASGTVTITHNADGTKSISYGFSMAVEITWSGTYNGTLTASAMTALPTIPRATKPTVASNIVTIGEALAITLNRASQNFTHNLKLQLGSSVTQIAQDVATSYTWTLPMELCNQITQGVSSTGILWCETYQGDNHIGSASINLTVKVPLSVVPSVTSVTVTDTSEVDIGQLVQGLSKISVVIATSGTYGSTIKDKTSTLDGITYKSNFETDVLMFSGTQNIETIVTDSRGRQIKKITPVSVLEYYTPKINVFKVERCLSDGTLNDSGKCAKITYQYDIPPLSNLNTVSVKFTSGQTQITEITTGYTGNSTYVTGEIFDIDSSHEIVMTVTDKYSSVSSSALLETDKTTFDIHSSGQGMAFGKVAESTNLLDIAWNAKFRGDVAFKNDTEWTDLTLESTFKPYQDNVANTPKYRIIGRIVEIRGAVSPVSQIASAFSPVIFAQLPDLIKPSSDIYMLCAGGNKNTWTLTANSNGLGVGQYGGASYGTIGTSERLAFQIMYTI